MFKKMNKVVALLFVLFVFFPFAVHAAQPTSQSGTGTYSTTGSGNYKEMGYSLMFGGYTTSVSIGDPAVVVSKNTASPMFNEGFEVVTFSDNSRVARGSIYTLTFEGTYEWYNYEIVINPANFDQDSVVTGRSLLDNLYQETGVDRIDLTDKLINGGTAWVNAIHSGTYYGGPHSTMYAGRLWSDGSSNYSYPGYAFSTDQIIPNFDWTSTTEKALAASFDNQFTFPPMPDMDDEDPYLLDIFINDSRNIEDLTYWFQPNDNPVIRVIGRDDDSGLDRSNLRLEGGGNDNRVRHYWTDNSTVIDEYNVGEDTDALSGQEINAENYEFKMNIHSTYTHGDIYSVDAWFSDVVGNTSGWVTNGKQIGVDGVAPTVTATPNSSGGWTNTDVSVDLSYTDANSGMELAEYQWTQSTTTPTSGWLSTAYTSTQTQTSNGTWYLHYKARDKAENVTTGYFGPYKIDKIDPYYMNIYVNDSRYIENGLYWYQPGDNPRIRVIGGDDESYLNRTNLRLMGSGNDNRVRHYWNEASGVFDEYNVGETTSTVSGQEINGENYEFLMNIDAAGTHGHVYDVDAWYTDNAGNSVGWVNNGKQVAVDGVGPSHVQDSYSGYRYVNGNTYWIHPNDVMKVKLRADDPESGVSLSGISVGTGSSREIGNHDWNGTTANLTKAEDTNVNYNVLTANRSYVSGSVKEVEIEVQGLAHGALDNVRYRYVDNVGNDNSNTTGHDTYGWSSSLSYIGVDGMAPTVTANPGSSGGWTNADVSVDLSFTDADSGMAAAEYQWTQSATTPTSGWLSTTYASTKTQTSNGTWYLHYRGTDNVGHVTTGYAGPYKIDKTLPGYANYATVSGAGYVNGNDHWFNPGDPFNVKIRHQDTYSGVHYNYLRVDGDGNDNRSSYDWLTGNMNEFNVGEYTDHLQAGKSYSSGNYREVYWDVLINTTADGKDFNILTSSIDVAGNYSGGYVDTGKLIRVDGTAPTIAFRNKDDTSDYHSSAWSLPTVEVRLKFNDGGRSGYKQSRYAWTNSTATPASWSAWTTTSDYVVSKATYGEWYLHVQAEDNMGHIRTTYKGPYRYNNAPTSSFTLDKSSYFVGDPMIVTNQASDPDGNSITYEYTITQPDGSTVTKTVPDFTYTLPDMPGIYTVKQVVTDEHGHSDSASISVEVQDLDLTGRVKHAPNWETRHTDNGNAPLQFYSGEKFNFEADVTDQPLNSVEVDFSALQTNGNTYTVSDMPLNKISNILYTGSLEDPQLAEGGTRLADGFHTFRFTAYYSNGVVRTDDVTIEIIGDVYDAFDFHKKY